MAVGLPDDQFRCLQMLRLVGAAAKATGTMGRCAATQLRSSRHPRPLHAASAEPKPMQNAQRGDTQQQAQYKLVVSLTDFDYSKSKLRLDAFLAAKLPSASRARLQASIKEGLVAVNGRPQAKASHGVRPGDMVTCSVLPPPPLEAVPEPLLLDIVYEDEHLVVINKAADMVMHPSPGHYSGTLVNALLHHCQLPAMQLGAGAAIPLSLEGASAAAATAAALSSTSDADGGNCQQDAGQLLVAAEQQGSGATAAAGLVAGSEVIAAAAGGRAAAEDAAAAAAALSSTSDAEQSELEEEEDNNDTASFRPVGTPTSTADGTVRPGIVHRLDKGTTGLVVVAKTDAAHVSLAQQFKDRSVRRTYMSVTLGVPQPPEGRVATNVGRDLRDRKKMAAFTYASARGRTAISSYKLLEVLAGGGAALVQWRLETGRTHQIRVHAKHIGHPLLADDTYSSAAAAGSIVGAGKPPRSAAAHAAVKALARPALHAKTLGFVHPATGQKLEFDSELPLDLQYTLEVLRGTPFV